MVALNSECPPLDGVAACAALPLSFVRLRYFFGKRLGVADFVDQQLYHAAKMKFHNQHAHGAGVLCGLKIGQLNGSPTELRVTRGAALDRCGREIIVGTDQCIDVDAWIAKQVAADPSFIANNVTNHQLEICVVLRYSECTISPEPAPRDPCACDDGGCEFGRIREGFELDLMPGGEAHTLTSPTEFPSEGDLAGALAAAVSGTDFDQRLAGLVTGQPPNPAGDDWLVLGCAVYTLDVNNHPTGNPNIEPIAPPLVLETTVIQDLLLRLLAGGYQAGALADGAPQVASVAFSSSNGANKVGNSSQLLVSLSSAIIPKTTGDNVNLDFFSLDPVNGWQTVTLPLNAVTAANDGLSITLSLGNLTAPGSGTLLYRLTLEGDPSEPICDTKGRPLLPQPFSWDFVVDSTGAVKPATYA